MPIVIVEHTNDALPQEEKDRIHEKLGPCLEARYAKWMRSYVGDNGQCFCQFEAPDAESVRQAWRNAGSPFTRVWVVKKLEIGTAAENACKDGAVQLF